MRRIWLPALISVLLIGTTAVPALADKELPFKAKTVVVNENPSNGCVDTDHIGTGTHLGRFTLSETLCVTPPTSRWTERSWPPTATNCTSTPKAHSMPPGLPAAAGYSTVVPGGSRTPAVKRMRH